jgi:predicted RNA-binding protein with PIN domain
MPILIDGNNLLGLSAWSEPQLIRKCLQLSGKKGLRIVLCFDGERDHGDAAQQIGRVRILYSGVFRSADDVIEAEAGKLKNRANWTMYTNDRELRAAVNAHGMATERADTLLAQLRELADEAASEEKPRYESPEGRARLLHDMLTKARRPRD